MTNTDGGPIDLGPNDGAVQNPNNRDGEVSVSTNGPASVFVASGTYELPFGPGKLFLNQDQRVRPRDRWLATNRLIADIQTGCP